MYILGLPMLKLKPQGWDKTFKINTNETIWILKLSDEEQYDATWEKAPAWPCIWRIILQSNFMQ
jgi:hypothetical protein